MSARKSSREMIDSQEVLRVLDEISKLATRASSDRVKKILLQAACTIADLALESETAVRKAA